jgi:predicted lipoprotein with Yx(FWY)xxD motif
VKIGETKWTARRGVVAGILPVAAIVLAACGSSSASSGTTATAASNVSAASTVDVKTGTTSLGTVLVNSRGRTLYHLTAEKNGKFICTGSCTQTWHPLRPKAKTAKGTVHFLGTIRRPDRTRQVTYKGFPLYTFAGDSKAGDVKGQGFKDVGTWKAIVIKKPAATMPTPTQTQTTPPSSGYGY